MSRPLVSVILPVRNAGPTLAEALESVLAQSFTDFEVVAVDDGSTDRSPEILHAYAAKDARIRPVSGEHEGLIAALNRALRMSRGALIARMDADDRSRPLRLERQVARLRARPGDSVVGCLVESFPREQVRNGFRIYEEWLNSLVRHEEIVRDIYIESPLAHPSVMLRRAELLALGGYADRGWPEDYDLWHRYHLAGRRFSKVPEVLYDWRESPDRLTFRDSRYAVENFIRAKAHYLLAGPVNLGRKGSRPLFLWGAGRTGRRISKHLLRGGARIAAFIDIDSEKIGRTLRGVEVVAPADLRRLWRDEQSPLLLAAVASRGARKLIREEVRELGIREGVDFYCVA